LTADGIDIVLTIDPEWSDMLTRAVAQLSVTAVLYEPKGSGEMTIGDQLQCARVLGLAGKPLFVAVPASWGTASLVVPAAETAAFKEAIRTLPPRKRGDDRHDVASLPAATLGRRAGRDDDDEEDRAAGPATLG
jgi:hypothetical protein